MNPEIARLLVERGMPVNLQDQSGDSLLLSLISNDGTGLNLAAAKVLIEKGAEESKDKKEANLR